MTERTLYIVAYDICSPKRLRRALHVVRHYATGGQKSVFECFLSQKELHELLMQCDEMIDPEEDRVALFPVHHRARVKTLGIGEKPEDPDYFYVG